MPPAYSRRATRCVLMVGATVALASVRLAAQSTCPVPEVTSGLLKPLGITQSPLGALLVSESGTPVPNTGRLSIVDLDGERRTLLDGLPSGINDVGDPSGPAGLFMRGRTLYVVIGVGDSYLPGGVPNPNPASSPIFGSVLAIHFSASVEKTTEGFMLSVSDHQALANAEQVELSNGSGDTITLELIAKMLDALPGNENPFDLVAIGDQLYVTDGGRNLVWEIDIPTGAFGVLTTFPQIPNPLFGIIGPPFTDAVPTGITESGGQLLVTLFSGVPFAPGTSVVEQVDPVTGAHAPLITGLKTAIDVVRVKEAGDADFLVLQHASAGPFFGSPGVLLRFDTPGAGPTIVSNCLSRPTSMAFDRKTGTAYVTELLGRLVAVSVGP
jgi:hypothetical protein